MQSVIFDFASSWLKNRAINIAHGQGFGYFYEAFSENFYIHIL